MKRIIGALTMLMCLLNMTAFNAFAQTEAGQTVEVAAGNVIINGSFENGIPEFTGDDGWYKRANVTSVEWDNDETYDNSVGSMHINMKTASGSSWEGQSAFAITAQVRKNAWYKFSYKVKAGTAGVNARTYYFVGNGSAPSPSTSQLRPANLLSAVKDGDWVSYEGYFQVNNEKWMTTDAETADSLYEAVTVYPGFYYGSTGASLDFYVDDIKLERVEGTLNSDFSLGTAGWNNIGEVVSVPGAPNESGMAVKIVASSTAAGNRLRQRVAVDKDKMYSVSAWVMVPKENPNPAKVKLGSDDSSVRQNNQSISGNMASSSNSGTYIPNDGKWYHITSLLVPELNTSVINCKDTDIFMGFSTSADVTASSGSLSSDDCIYVAQYEVKPDTNILNVVNSNNNKVRSGAGVYFTLQTSSYKGFTAASTDGYAGSGFNGALKTAIPTTTSFNGATTSEVVDVTKGPSFVLTCGYDGEEAYPNRGAAFSDNKLYDIECYVRLDSTSKGTEKAAITIYPFGKERVKYGEIALTDEWQKISLKDQKISSKNNRIGMSVSGITGGEVVNFRDFTVTEKDPEKSVSVDSISLSESDGALSANYSVSGDTLYAMSYKYYYKAQGSAEYIFVDGGETVYGGSVPVVEYGENSPANGMYKLELRATSSDGHRSDIKTAYYGTGDFIVNAPVLTKADGAVLTSITAVDSVGASVNVTNETNKAKPLVLMVASYAGDDEAVENISVKSVEIPANTLTADVRLDDVIVITQNTASVKIFVWDSLKLLNSYLDEIYEYTK